MLAWAGGACAHLLLRHQTAQMNFLTASPLMPALPSGISLCRELGAGCGERGLFLATLFRSVLCMYLWQGSVHAPSLLACVFLAIFYGKRRMVVHYGVSSLFV